jgi:hypothetical protein
MVVVNGRLVENTADMTILERYQSALSVDKA